MSSSLAQDNTTLDDAVVHGALVARRITDGLAWGEGDIRPQAEFANAGDQHKLIEAVLEVIEPVAESELPYSSCTDGRLPIKLASGENIPVREQMVGADIVSAFYIAEALGSRFYKNPDAPVADRVADVAAFLHENGLLPSSHIACGAAGGFVTIAKNIVRFGRNPAYIERLKSLVPEGGFDAELHGQMLAASEARLEENAYEGLSAQTFIDAVLGVSDERAIAELADDGRGVHGHVEEAIMRLRLPGRAINTAKLAAATGGREVFGVNDNRMDKLVRLFARGDDRDYRVAAMAAEDFASSGHGTLAKDLPTYIITAS